MCVHGPHRNEILQLLIDVGFNPHKDFAARHDIIINTLQCQIMNRTYAFHETILVCAVLVEDVTSDNKPTTLDDKNSKNKTINI